MVGSEGGDDDGNDGDDEGDDEGDDDGNDGDDEGDDDGGGDDDGDDHGDDEVDNDDGDDNGDDGDGDGDDGDYVVHSCLYLHTHKSVSSSLCFYFKKNQPHRRCRLPRRPALQWPSLVDFHSTLRGAGGHWGICRTGTRSNSPPGWRMIVSAMMRLVYA